MCEVVKLANYTSVSLVCKFVSINIGDLGKFVKFFEAEVSGQNVLLVDYARMGFTVVRVIFLNGLINCVRVSEFQPSVQPAHDQLELQ